MQFPTNLEDVLAQEGGAALVVDEWGTVLFGSEQACHLLKYGPSELHGVGVEQLMPERFRLAHIGQRLRFTDDRRTRPMGTGLELFVLCKDGAELRVDISLHPVQRGLKTLIIVVVQPRESNSRASPPN